MWLREDGVIDAQLGLHFRGNEILRGGERLGRIHHHGDGRWGRVLCQEERKDVAEDVALGLVGLSFGQEGEIPGSNRTRTSLMKSNSPRPLVRVKGGRSLTWRSCTKRG